MLPVIALVGRPNVGKSTLFNRLTRSRDAIVDDQPGVTRDRLYGRGQIGNKPFLVVDSGGVTFGEEGFDVQIQEQVEQVITEADEVYFIVDADGLHPHDAELANLLRKEGASVHLLVNKAEGIEPQIVVAEFQQLGLGHPHAVSARRGDGVANLIEQTLADYVPETEPLVDPSVPKVALIGRPNAGKSTLTNALLGEARVIVSEVPGTTRDSVSVPIEHRGQKYIVTDTAGVRRRSRVDEVLEKFSVVKTLQAIERSNVAILVIDAHEGISAQDATIAGMILEMGRAMVVLLNKWDGLSSRERRIIHDELERKQPFIANVEILEISALYGSAVGNVLPMARRAFDSTLFEFPTSALNRIIEKAVEKTPTPSKQGRSIRIKFAHQAGKNPPVIVLHGNQLERLPKSYLRYLKSVISDFFSLVGTPIRIITRESKNPFNDKDKKKRIQGIANPKRRIQKRKQEKKDKDRRAKNKQAGLNKPVSAKGKSKGTLGRKSKR